MSKRAYSPREISQMKYTPIPWEGDWRRVFGQPDITDTWLIEGASAAGKSTFVMQLAKKLCEYGAVLYVSYEEGVRMTFQDRLKRCHMDEVQGRFRVVTDDTIDDVRQRLGKKKAPRFVIVDSFQIGCQNYGWTYEAASRLIEEYPHKSFLFITQMHKGAPMGKPAQRLKYLAGVKVSVRGYKAYCQGREIENAGEYFTVWEGGTVQTSNE